MGRVAGTLAPSVGIAPHWGINRNGCHSRACSLPRVGGEGAGKVGATGGEVREGATGGEGVTRGAAVEEGSKRGE